MSTIALPAGFVPNMFAMTQMTNQRAVGSPGGGSEQVVDMMNDRWQVSLTLPNRSRRDAARIEAFIAALRGMSNTVALWHFGRPEPQGTYRGTLSIFLPSGPGADTVYLKGGGAAQTVLAGDLFSANGMLVMAASDAVADGLGRIGVPIVNRLRKATAADQPVVWSKPTALFRLTSGSASAVQHIPGYTPEVALDFVEAIL